MQERSCLHTARTTKAGCLIVFRDGFAESPADLYNTFRTPDRSVLLVKVTFCPDRSNKEDIIESRDRQIEQLGSRFEQLATFNDPELLSIYREDPRERLRIERESIAGVNESMLRAVESQRPSRRARSQAVS